MIAFIDNKDSFTFNIVQSLERVSGGKVQVFRSEESTVAEIEAAKPTHIVVGPGPGTPLEAGISVEAIKYFAGNKRLLKAATETLWLSQHAISGQLASFLQISQSHQKQPPHKTVLLIITSP